MAKKKGEAPYLAHFRDGLQPRLRELEGFLGATVLRRERGDAVEITVLTRWQSMEAIRAFAAG